MSILPNRIFPPSEPVLNPDGTFQKNIWLFLYNLAEQVLGSGNFSAAAFAAQLNADLDADVDSTDAISLVQRISNLETQLADAKDEITNLLYLRQRVSNLENQVTDPEPSAGVTATVTTAKLTTATGTMKFQQGRLISQVQAT